MKQLCQQLENASRDLGAEATDTLGDEDITAKLEQRIIEVAKTVITARVETNRISGKVDKSWVEVPLTNTTRKRGWPPPRPWAKSPAPSKAGPTTPNRS